MSKDNRMADRLVRGVRKAKGDTVSKQPSKPAPRKPVTGRTATGKTAGRPPRVEPSGDELHPERIWPD